MVTSLMDNDDSINSSIQGSILGSV